MSENPFPPSMFVTGRRDEWLDLYQRHALPAVVDGDVIVSRAPGICIVTTPGRPELARRLAALHCVIDPEMAR